MIQFDFEGVKEQTSGDPVPPGTYLCEVEEAVVRTSQREGEERSYPYVNFRLRILDGEQVDRVLFYTATTAPRGIGFTKAVFSSFGVDTSHNISGQTDELGNLVDPDLLGLQCEATVARRRRNGEDRNDVVKLVGLASAGSDGVQAPEPAPAPAPRSGGTAARPTAPPAPATRQAPRRIYRD